MPFPCSFWLSPGWWASRLPGLRSVPLGGAGSADVPPPLARPLDGISSTLGVLEFCWRAAGCVGEVWRAASCACHVAAPWFLGFGVHVLRGGRIASTSPVMSCACTAGYIVPASCSGPSKLWGLVQAWLALGNSRMLRAREGWGGWQRRGALRRCSGSPPWFELTVDGARNVY